MDFKTKIREVKDWPKLGVSFKDITTLLQDREAFKETIDGLTGFFADQRVDKVVGVDARGFLMAAPVAYKLGAGLAIARKPGKLPCAVVGEDYVLEYAENAIQMHSDSIGIDERVLLVDDLIATGGTAVAACNLIEKLGGIVVGVAVVIDLPFLGGSEKLKDRGYDVKSLVTYESE